MEAKYNKYGRRELQDEGGVWRCRALEASGDRVVLECCWENRPEPLLAPVPPHWWRLPDAELLDLVRSAPGYAEHRPGPREDDVL